jgi:predicted kinase
MPEGVLLIGLPGAGRTCQVAASRTRVPGALVDRDRLRAAMFPEPFDHRREKDAANGAVWAAVTAHLTHGRQVRVDGR